MLTVGEAVGERRENSVIAVAGALEPSCEATNMVLLAMCPKEKKTVVITGIPLGPGIPEEIRKGWIGAIIKGSHGPFTTGATSIVTENSDRATFVKGFVVETSVALQSLKIVSAMSWEWFLNKNLPEYLFFNEECCKIIA